MNSLYEITNSFLNLMNKAEEGEITEEEYNKIGEELALQLQAKSPNLIGYYQNQNILIEAIDQEIKRLQDYKKARQNNLDRYKQYLKDNMEKLGITKLETEVGSLSIAKSPISVEIVNEDIVPNEYKLVVTTTKIDKKAISDNFKSTGEIPDGVVIHTDNTNLRIK